MKLESCNILLRDYEEKDIEDDIRWNTVETEWALWDAPWEMEEEIKKFNPVIFRKQQMEKLEKGFGEGFRWTFEVDTIEGVHVGGVNSYLIDENYEWILLKNVKEGQKVYHTLGVEITESSYWGRGLGTQALAAFIKYHLDNHIMEMCLQTWSGNIRMVKSAEKLGFTICNRKVGIREVRGEIFDSLTFILDVEKFYAFMKKNKF